MPEDNEARKKREQMVQYQIHERGICDHLVLSAMLTVPRHLFVPDTLITHAYEDRPLPIGSDQTISQPYIVALMTALLAVHPGDSVLEIGTGSGYQAAILATMGAVVISIERKEEVLQIAKRNLNRAGITGVSLVRGDGTAGYPSRAPYKGIIVTAAAPKIPDSLVNQLDDGGRLVIPAGDRYIQELVLVERKGDRIIQTMHGAVRFVPLIGEEGYPEEYDT